MSAIALATLLSIAGSCPAMQDVPGNRAAFLSLVERTARTESGLRSDAVHRNANGTLDAGVMQVNSANWSRFGLNAQTIMDPQRNICAGVAVLAEAYVPAWHAACAYNTGKRDCANGYAERVMLAQATGDDAASVPPVARPAPPARPLEDLLPIHPAQPTGLPAARRVVTLLDGPEDTQ